MQSPDPKDGFRSESSRSDGVSQSGKFDKATPLDKAFASSVEIPAYVSSAARRAVAQFRLYGDSTRNTASTPANLISASVERMLAGKSSAHDEADFLNQLFQDKSDASALLGYLIEKWHGSNDNRSVSAVVQLAVALKDRSIPGEVLSGLIGNSRYKAFSVSNTSALLVGLPSACYEELLQLAGSSTSRMAGNLLSITATKLKECSAAKGISVEQTLDSLMPAIDTQTPDAGYLAFASLGARLARVMARDNDREVSIEKVEYLYEACLKSSTAASLDARTERHKLIDFYYVKNPARCLSWLKDLLDDPYTTSDQKGPAASDYLELTLQSEPKSALDLLSHSDPEVRSTAARAVLDRIHGPQMNTALKEYLVLAVLKEDLSRPCLSDLAARPLAVLLRSAADYDSSKAFIAKVFGEFPLGVEDWKAIFISFDQLVDHHRGPDRDGTFHQTSCDIALQFALEWLAEQRSHERFLAQNAANFIEAMRELGLPLVDMMIHHLPKEGHELNKLGRQVMHVADLPVDAYPISEALRNSRQSTEKQCSVVDSDEFLGNPVPVSSDTLILARGAVLNLLQELESKRRLRDRKERYHGDVVNSFSKVLAGERSTDEFLSHLRALNSQANIHDSNTNLRPLVTLFSDYRRSSNVSDACKLASVLIKGFRTIAASELLGPLAARFDDRRDTEHARQFSINVVSRLREKEYEELLKEAGTYHNPTYQRDPFQLAVSLIEIDRIRGNDPNTLFERLLDLGEPETTKWNRSRLHAVCRFICNVTRQVNFDRVRRLYFGSSEVEGAKENADFFSFRYPNEAAEQFLLMFEMKSQSPEIRKSALECAAKLRSPKLAKNLALYMSSNSDPEGSKIATEFALEHPSQYKFILAEKLPLRLVVAPSYMQTPGEGFIAISLLLERAATQVEARELLHSILSTIRLNDDVFSDIENRFIDLKYGAPAPKSVDDIFKDEDGALAFVDGNFDLWGNEVRTETYTAKAIAAIGPVEILSWHTNTTSPILRNNAERLLNYYVEIYGQEKLQLEFARALHAIAPFGKPRATDIHLKALFDAAEDYISE